MSNAKTKRKPAEHRWGDGRVAVLGVRDELAKWLNDGGTMSAFYEEHQTRLGISYSQFRRHCNHFIRKPKASPNEPQAPERSNRTQQPAAAPGNAAERSDRSGALPQFQHKPEVGQTDDLI